MEQGIVFKQPFKKSITFRTVFYSVLLLFFACFFGCMLLQFKLISFNLKLLVVFVSCILLVLEFLFLGFSLFFRSNYVILYDDRLVCINRFLPFLINTYYFSIYRNYSVIIYTKSPYAYPIGSYAMICFCAPGKKWWKMKDYQFIASVSADDCIKLARMMAESGMDVKIYNK